MISLTRLSGSQFLLNADLIERVDATPDTVVTLVDGTKYVVSEPLDEVLGEIVDYRARIVARAPMFEEAPGYGPVHQPHGGADHHREHRDRALPSHLSPVPTGSITDAEAAINTAVPTTAGRRAGERRRGGNS